MTRLRIRTAALAALALPLALATTAGVARAQAPAPAASAAKATKCKPQRGSFLLTLKPESELKDYVEWIQAITCKRFIYPVNLSGRSTKITIYSQAPVTADEAWRLFLTVMQQMQLTVVPNGGGYYKLTESLRAKDELPPIFRNPGSVPGSDQVVTALIRTNYVSPDELSQLLSGLKSNVGIISTYAPGNLLIITDFGSSIRRLVKVVREVDLPAANEGIFVVQLNKVPASEMVQRLNEIFAQQQSGRGGGGNSRRSPMPRASEPDLEDSTGPIPVSASDVQATKILGDERTNSVIIVSSPASYQRILAVIKVLDREIHGAGQGRIHVYPLENADAEPLANTLNAIVSGNQRGGRQPATSSDGPFEGQVRISPHKETNSLIIVSSQQDFLALRDSIRRLDLPRRQVFVEAVILEVSIDKIRKLGVSFHGGGLLGIGGKDALAFGGVQNGDLSSLLLNPAALSGLAAGVIGPEIEGSDKFIKINGAGVSIPAFGIVLQALQTTTDVNVLSSPHILTTDNEQAEISVGENVPFQSSPGGAQAGAGFLPIIPQIQRQDVALKLSIKPHVNDSDMVRLEIKQEVSRITAENFNQTGSPKTSKSTLETMVVVRDQQPVVLGGLMTDRVALEEAKVPLLGDLPILGYFFRQRKRVTQKANLLIFLTPYVIKNQGDLRRIYEKKLRERREFIETYTAFKDREFEANIDYRRKRGLIEEINKAVMQAEEDDRLLREAEESLRSTEFRGPVQMPANDPGNDPDGDGSVGEPDGAGGPGSDEGDLEGGGSKPSPSPAPAPPKKKTETPAPAGGKP